MTDYYDFHAIYKQQQLKSHFMNNTQQKINKYPGHESIFEFKINPKGIKKKEQK